MHFSCFILLLKIASERQDEGRGKQGPEGKTTPSQSKYGHYLNTSDFEMTA